MSWLLPAVLLVVNYGFVCFFLDRMSDDWVAGRRPPFSLLAAATWNALAVGVSFAWLIGEVIG